MLRFSTKYGERVQLANQFNVHYGGAEANVGVSLANFGYDVFIVSKIPENQLGKTAEKHLKSFGIHTDYLLKGGERLGTYYLETGVGERGSQVIYGCKHSSFSQLTNDEIKFDEIFQGADLFHVTGITIALSPTLQELTLLSLQKAKEHGVTIWKKWIR
ncbi:PfkB family carbohydrate kinase [Lederbergia wuyishanensis]|uniref:Sugar/nucleoside kinase (Ribokinase family) n=1 Tax=Lederbergia wuyishanensis TaxID=1347903 RepID=A0ABU0D939_9BACI|nr:PfkB family carbohydrate kinase [Lederbergia wuyishanensis]MCJ8009495.1 PfkB family carbohydrate kinase [Lederbergia wuyishanensis]MDQ0344895.1 sugar/nucleoside kinase (ribokinase family) [Lederbergia wuyishanensis]